MTTHGSRLGRILYYLLIALTAVLGIVALAGLAALIFALVAPDQWPAQATLRIDGGAPMALDINAAKVAGSAAILGAVALAALVVVPLVGLMRSAAAGTPFVIGNVRRLHFIAGAFAAYATIRIVMPLVVAPDTATLLGLEGPTFDIGPILMALVVTVLAEVFRQGVALREDVEGTV